MAPPLAVDPATFGYRVQPRSAPEEHQDVAALRETNDAQLTTVTSVTWKCCRRALRCQEREPSHMLEEVYGKWDVRAYEFRTMTSRILDAVCVTDIGRCALKRARG